MTLDNDNYSRRIGITYDPTNHSLWITGMFGSIANLVENRKMDGTLISSFRTTLSALTAIALDPKDGTLWMTTQTGSKHYHQYTKSGEYLGSVTFAEVEGIALGGEFAFVPLPPAALMGLAGVGGLGLARLWARRHSIVSKCSFIRNMPHK